MKFTRNKISINHALLISIVSIAFLSCNNDNNKATNKNEMPSSKEGKHKAHDADMDNMKGMDMGDQNDMGDSKAMNPKIRANDTLVESLVLPANYRIISSQRSVKPVQSRGINSIKSQGYISIDERRNNKVASRISGRIEKLYIKYSLQYVKKGDRLMDVYSPELNTYQAELLFLLKNSTDQNLINQAEEKLRLLGITQTQINNIKKSGQPIFAISIYSPQNGYVFYKNETSNGMGTMKSSSQNLPGNGMGMGNGGSSPNVISTTGQIREGSYVNKGDILFWINDLEEVWAMIAVDNIHQQELRTGAKVSLISEFYKNDTIRAVINLIEPVYQQSQKFILSRVYLKNPDRKYKINSLVDAIINTDTSTTVMIPYSSILFLGKRKIVWVLVNRTADNNRSYEAREVTIGLTHNGMVEIKSGVHANEEIAYNAGYLLDRESLIKPE